MGKNLTTNASSSRCLPTTTVPQIEYTVSTVNQQIHLVEFPQIDSGLVVPVFKQRDDPIDRPQQATNHDGRVTIQPLQGRPNSYAAGTSGTRANTPRIGWNNSDNTQSQRRKRDATWFRDKVLSGDSLRNGKVLNEEELEFLADPAKAVLMTNLSSYSSDVLSEIRPMLYDGNVTTKETNVISIDDSEETLMLEEESRSKMILKQSDIMVLEKKVNIKPVNYVVLNQLSEDLVDVPSELPKVSLVNASLKKLKFYLAQFDSVVKKRITPDALTEGEWSIKNDLRKLKGKDIVDNAAQVTNATTIAPGMYKLDRLILAPRDKNNRETHIYYLKHTMEQASIFKEIVEQAKSLNPLDMILMPLIAVTPINKKKIVRFAKPVASSTNILKVTNRPSLSSIGVKPSTSARGSKPSGNTKNDRISRPPSSNEKNKYPVKGAKALCSICNKCMFDANHAIYLIDHVNSTTTNKLSIREPIPLKVGCLNGSVVLESGCSKHMIGDRSQLNNFIHKFLGTVKFGNDQVVKIIGYGDYHIGNVKISRVYYVEGIGHNLFSVRQLCDPDLEVAFRKHTCFVFNLKGVDLLSGSQGTNLFDTSAGNPVKEILLKLSLPDHRIFKDGGEGLKGASNQLQDLEPSSLAINSKLSHTQQGVS
ncbi:hypothetical protein Tco_0665969 [Tanacetum coccineum]